MGELLETGEKEDGILRMPYLVKGNIIVDLANGLLWENGEG